ncbi:hypothetical protein [Rhizobium leguminosarum]
MKKAPEVLAVIISSQMFLFVPSVSLASDASCEGTAMIATGNYIPDVVNEEKGKYDSSFHPIAG